MLLSKSQNFVKQQSKRKYSNSDDNMYLTKQRKEELNDSEIDQTNPPKRVANHFLSKKYIFHYNITHHHKTDKSINQSQHYVC